ncbi:Chaperone protein HscC [hydrothermal vent metagenome]|uniref:Chaperone protein HscC n=1 Tax=hydrothermal vent metagenome TaxID=652676 RepID=A0A3B0YAD7_9ZZZZ
MIGIDLGTTNSLIAIFENSTAKIIPNILNEKLTPSVVGVGDDGAIITGKAAQLRLLSHPDITTALFKRDMGSDRHVSLGEHKFRAEELSAFILKSLKEDAQNYTGHEISKCVISVPAYFNDTQRKAVKAAGVLAGLTVQRVINEPSAAAIAYGLHQHKPETQYLVIDLGGGTFDVSLLDFFDGVLEIKATSGDNFLGGEDFLDKIINDFLVKSAISPDSLTSAEKAQLKLKSEHCKHLLSTQNEVSLSAEINQITHIHHYTQASFKELSKELLQRIKKNVLTVLRDAQVKESDIEKIVLVGGATRMHIIHNLVETLFKKTPQLSFNPDEAIALGAAIQSALIDNSKGLADIILTDVCPYTLGTAAYDSGELCYFPVIERNSSIPVSKSRTFYKRHDDQQQLSVKIFQGENFDINKNILLGEINIDIPTGKGSSEHHSLDLRFTYDIDGILDIDARINNTDTHKNLLIEQNPGLLTASQISEKLKNMEKLKIHPREQTENLVLLELANTAYAEALKDNRKAIKAEILKFKKSLASQNMALIEESQKSLRAFLSTLKTSMDRFK